MKVAKKAAAANNPKNIYLTISENSETQEFKVTFGHSISLYRIAVATQDMIKCALKAYKTFWLAKGRYWRGDVDTALHEVCNFNHNFDHLDFDLELSSLYKVTALTRAMIKSALEAYRANLLVHKDTHTDIESVCIESALRNFDHSMHDLETELAKKSVVDYKAKLKSLDDVLGYSIDDLYQVNYVEEDEIIENNVVSRVNMNNTKNNYNTVH